MSSINFDLKRDKITYEYLYSNYAGSLYAIIFEVIKDANLSEQLLQAAFQRIWVGIERFDSKRSCLFAWMHNVVREIVGEHGLPIPISNDDCTDILELAYSYGLTLNDIATRQRLTIAEVRQCLRQAILHLREQSQLA